MGTRGDPPLNVFSKPPRTTQFDSRVEADILARLDDEACGRLDDVLRSLVWILERQPDNDRAVDLGEMGAWTIRSESVPGLESPAVTLVYRFDAATVYWWMIRIECDEPEVA